MTCTFDQTYKRVIEIPRYTPSYIPRVANVSLPHLTICPIPLRYFQYFTQITSIWHDICKTPTVYRGAEASTNLQTQKFFASLALGPNSSPYEQRYIIRQSMCCKHESQMEAVAYSQFITARLRDPRAVETTAARQLLLVGRRLFSLCPKTLT